MARSYLRVSSFETAPQGQFTPAQHQPLAASWELKVWLLISPWNGVTDLSVEQSEEMLPESGPCTAHLHPRAASAAHMTDFLTVLRKRTILVVARPKRVTSDSIKFKGQGQAATVLSVNTNGEEKQGKAALLLQPEQENGKL